MTGITQAPNTSTIRLADGREVFLSYGVVVAAFLPGRGYIKTDRKYSTTTSRHANTFAGADAITVNDDTLRQLVAPVVDTK